MHSCARVCACVAIRQQAGWSQGGGERVRLHLPLSFLMKGVFEPKKVPQISGGEKFDRRLIDNRQWHKTPKNRQSHNQWRKKQTTWTGHAEKQLPDVVHADVVGDQAAIQVIWHMRHHHAPEHHHGLPPFGLTIQRRHTGGQVLHRIKIRNKITK